MSAYFFASLFVVVIAGFFQGLTSFGFALIAMPLLSRIMTMREAVPLVVILSLVTNLLVLKDCHKRIQLKKVWKLIVASVVAAPLGAYSLVYVEGDYLKVFAGLVVVAVAGLLLSGKKFPIKNEKIAYYPVGFLSGFLNGSISMSGPPIALFLSNQGIDKNEFRANIAFYAVFLNVFTIASFAYGGLITGKVVSQTALYAASMAIGVYVGIRAIRSLDESLFRKIALALILVSGTVTLVAAALRLAK